MLHTQTLALATTVQLVSLSVFLTFFFFTRRTYPGFGNWTSALASLAIGYVLLSLRGIAPDAVSILAANYLLMTGMALLFDGILRFSGRAYSFRLNGPLHLLCAACVAVLAFYTFVDPNINARVVVVNLFRCISHGACVAALLYFQPKTDRATHRFLALLFFASVTLGVVRATFALNASPMLHLYDDPTFRLFMLLDLGVVAGIAFCLPVLTHMRVEQELEQERAIAERASRTDKLTGLWNRAYFEAETERRAREADRFKDELSMLMIDVDHFKAVNDKYGHLTGDDVLRHLASLARTCIRSTDLLCRWGGEEFLVVIRAPHEVAAQVAENLRCVIEGATFPVPQAITISVGVANRRTGEELTTWLARADHALYRAKAGGRNRIEQEGADAFKFSPLTLKWNPAFSTGEPVLDAQHRGLIELSAQLLERCTANDGKTVLHLTRKLLDDAARHYQYEEGVLRDRSYPDLEVHRNDHRRLCEKGEALFDRVAHGETDFSMVASYVLNDLIIGHIAEEDVAYIAHAARADVATRSQHSATMH
ncbi:diguanylate cyclase [Noviherbaspirillum sp. ST9]|uniref:diguanylate cyclase n=1 Tax=Noviherbaspirillum sp. ST9 TaxID=3401606 RepID=UPI003B58712C